MRRVERKLFVVIALLLFSASAVSAAGLSPFGVGARANSMGGAFRAIADDWSAAFWNPAGLAYLESSELDMTLLFVNQRPTYTPEISPALLNDGFNIKIGGERYPADRILPFPTFSGFITLPSVEGLAFGAAVYWTQDVNYSWDLYQMPYGYNAVAEITDDNYRLDLDVWDFHPTIAMELMEDKLSAGLGISIRRGDILFHRMHQWVVPNYNLEYYRFIGTMLFDGNGVGYGANAGLLYKVNDRLTLGLSGQTPVTIGLEGSTRLKFVSPSNQAIWNLAFDPKAIIGTGTDFDEKPFAMDLKLPGSLGLGLAYQANEQWTLAADLAVNFWSQLEEWRFEFTEGALVLFDALDSIRTFTMPINGKDQLQLSLGAQYQIRENLILRGGYSFDQSAIPDETRRPYFPDYGARHGLSAGGSFFLESFEISCLLGGWFSSSRTVEELSDLNNDEQFDNFPGKYGYNQYEVLISTIYRF